MQVNPQVYLQRQMQAQAQAAQASQNSNQGQVTPMQANMLPQGQQGGQPLTPGQPMGVPMQGQLLPQYQYQQYQLLQRAHQARAQAQQSQQQAQQNQAQLPGQQGQAPPTTQSQQQTPQQVHQQLQQQNHVHAAQQAQLAQQAQQQQHQQQQSRQQTPQQGHQTQPPQSGPAHPQPSPMNQPQTLHSQGPQQIQHGLPNQPSLQSQQMLQQNQQKLPSQPMRQPSIGRATTPQNRPQMQNANKLPQQSQSPGHFVTPQTAQPNQNTPQSAAAHTPSPIISSQNTQTNHNPNQQTVVQPGASNQAAMALNGAQVFTKTPSMAILRLMQFCEALNVVSDQKLEMDYWRRVIGQFFTETATVKYALNDGKETKIFELPAAILPRFYQTFTTSGVQRIQIHLEHSRPQLTPANGYFVECPKASVSYWIGNDSMFTSSGMIRVLFNDSFKIEQMEQSTHDHHEYISRAMGLALLKETDTTFKERLCPFGVTEPVMRFLQISDTITQMKDLFTPSVMPNSGGPLKTFESLHNKINSRSFQQQQLQLAQQQHLQQQQEQLKQQQLANKQPERDGDDKSGIKKEEPPSKPYTPFQPPNGQQPMGNNEPMMNAMNAARMSPQMTHNTGKPYPFNSMTNPNMAASPSGPPPTSAPQTTPAGNTSDRSSTPAMSNFPAPRGAASNRPSPRLGTKRRRASAKDEPINSPKMRPSPKMQKK